MRARLRVFWFFILAYALSWAGNAGNWLMPGPWWPVPINPAGPLVAAVVILWFTEGKPGLRAWFARIREFPAPPWLYVLALLAPIAFILASLGMTILSGFSLTSLPHREAAEFVILIPIMLLLGPLPEEISFRGFAQVDLERTMPSFDASLWIGFGVLIWHLPVFFGGNVSPPIIAAIIAVSVIYAWMLKTGGSVWPLVVLHFSVNYFGGEYLGAMAAGEKTQLVYTAFLAAFFVAWAAIIVWRAGRNLARQDNVT